MILRQVASIDVVEARLSQSLEPLKISSRIKEAYLVHGLLLMTQISNVKFLLHTDRLDYQATLVSFIALGLILGIWNLDRLSRKHVKRLLSDEALVDLCASVIKRGEQREIRRLSVCIATRLRPLRSPFYKYLGRPDLATQISMGLITRIDQKIDKPEAFREPVLGQFSTSFWQQWDNVPH